MHGVSARQLRFRFSLNLRQRMCVCQCVVCVVCVCIFSPLSRKVMLNAGVCCEEWRNGCVQLS